MSKYFDFRLISNEIGFNTDLEGAQNTHVVAEGLVGERALDELRRPFKLGDSREQD